jgi:tripartite-type tricarboxylate transporter receptor subunit TctC
VPVKRLVSTVAGLLLAWSCALHATDHAPLPVSLIVPFPAGGSTDVLARVVSSRLADVWRQPVVVENMPGHPTISGTQSVANAEPNARTFLVANATLAINEALYRRLPYDALRSFAPISLLARQHLVFVVHAGSPVNTTAQLIDLARGGRAPVLYASAGNGSLSHLAGELLKLMTSGNFVHVPAGNPAAALDQVTAKHVACAIVALPRALPYLKSGRLRAIAVAGSHRATAVPDVPTIAGNVAGYNISTWIGLLAPYGVSVTTVRKLNADLQLVMRRPELVELLDGLGYEATSSTPHDFQNQLRADIERYSRIVFDAGIRMQ